MYSSVLTLWLFLTPSESVVDVTSVTITHDGGGRGRDETSWTVQKDMTLRRTYYLDSAYEAREEHSEFCAEILPGEAKTLKRTVNHLIESRWRNTKSFDQLEGSGGCSHGSIAKLSISYERADTMETIDVLYSADDDRCGTTRYSVPEVFVLHKLMTKLPAARYGDCD